MGIWKEMKIEKEDSRDVSERHDLLEYLADLKETAIRIRRTAKKVKKTDKKPKKISV